MSIGEVPGRDVHRLDSVSSTSTYIHPAQLSAGEAIYENSDSDDVTHRHRKKQRGGDSGSKSLRRWNVNELLSTPPRLIRKKIKNVIDAADGERQDGHRKLTASRSAGELIAAGTESFGKPQVAVERPTPRAEVSRFSYIYGSVGDDDDDGSSLATLDRLIPVYEEFKSATARSTSVTSQRMSDHFYASIDDLNDEPYSPAFGVHRPTATAIYEVAEPLPDDDEKSTGAPAARQSDVETDEDIPTGDPSDSFPCPICEEPSSACLDENDGGTCEFVAAMQELIVSQAVDARTCGNCATTAGDAGRRAAAWRCLDCRNDLCGPCHAAHASLRLRHRVVSVTDLQTGRHQGEISAALTTACRRHRDRDATSLCLDCGSGGGVVCGECRRDGEPHAGHRVTEQLGDVAARQRDLIGTLLDDTARRLDELKDNGHLIDEYRKQFEAERDDVIRAITTQVNPSIVSVLCTPSNMCTGVKF